MFHYKSDRLKRLGERGSLSYIRLTCNLIDI